MFAARKDPDVLERFAFGPADLHLVKEKMDLLDLEAAGGMLSLPP